MQVETYSAFFTLRDEEPSLSSSEEKSSEFDWLESKITRKQKYEKQSKCSVFYFLIKLYKGSIVLRTGSREISIWKITIIISKRLFILFPNLITKESYNWWVTRRVWGFRHQISKAKYLQVSVAHIWKLQENTVALCRKISKNVGRSPGERY